MGFADHPKMELYKTTPILLCSQMVWSGIAGQDMAGMGMSRSLAGKTQMTEVTQGQGLKTSWRLFTMYVVLRL